MPSRPDGDRYPDTSVMVLPFPVDAIAQPGRVLYMNVYTLSSPATVSDTRKNLTGHVARFRSEGVDADPVVFGDRRRPEAVLLPFDTFELLLEVAEDIVLAQRVRERAATDDGTRVTLAEAADRFGINLDDL